MGKGNNEKNIYLRNGIWQLEYMINDKRIKKSLGTSSKREAIKKRNDILGNIKDLKTEDDVIHKTARAKGLYNPSNFPINKWLDKYKVQENILFPDTAKTQIARHYSRLNKFIFWLDKNYNNIKFLHEITQEISKEYANWLLLTEITNRTYNEEINSLYKAIDTFKNEADIKENPFDTKVIVRGKRDTISRKELTEDETKTLLKSIPTLDIPYKEELEVLFHIMTWSGMRLKDSCLLEWDSIRFDTNNIYVTPFKTKKHGTNVIIPIHPLLKDYLLIAKTWQQNKYTLPILAGRYNIHDNLVNKYIRKIFDLNGFVNERINDNKRKVTGCLYGAHSLRYTFVSSCAKAGIPEIIVQAIVGHKCPAITKHYTRIDNRYRQEQFKKLDYMTKETKEIETANKKTIEDINSLLLTLDIEKLNNIFEFTKSLLDIQGINTKITADDIVEVLRETREKNT